MSLCFRTLPNKLTSFVNTRKQVTKIDRQLPKHVKSSFLDEFFCTQTTARNYRNGVLCSTKVHASYESNQFERSNKQCSQNEEWILCKWQHGPKNIKKSGISNYNVIDDLSVNEIVLENNVRWIKPLKLSNGFSKTDTHESLLCDIDVLSVNRTLSSSSIETDSEKPKTLRAETLPNVERSNENQPEKDSRIPSEEQLQTILETLTTDLPKLFVKPLNYGIYTKDVLLVNNIRGVTTTGLVQYLSQVALVKIIGHVKFAYVKFDIIKITAHPEDGTVKVRWRIKGITGFKVFTTFWKFNIFRIRDTIENQEAWYDGFSTYYVNGEGKVFKHVVDKMMPDQEIEEKEKAPIAAKLALFTALLDLDNYNLKEKI